MSAQIRGAKGVERSEASQGQRRTSMSAARPSQPAKSSPGAATMAGSRHRRASVHSGHEIARSMEAARATIAQPPPARASAGGEPFPRPDDSHVEAQRARFEELRRRTREHEMSHMYQFHVAEQIAGGH